MGETIAVTGSNPKAVGPGCIYQSEQGSRIEELGSKHD
jgi:hypothetical protein